MRQYQTTYEDSIYDPFEGVSRLFQYLSVEPAGSITIPSIEEESVKYRHTFVLDVDYQEQKRKRYNLWDALGDIGGFHDGLLLLIRLVIAPLAARNYFFDLISKSK